MAQEYVVIYDTYYTIRCPVVAQEYVVIYDTYYTIRCPVVAQECIVMIRIILSGVQYRSGTGVYSVMTCYAVSRRLVVTRDRFVFVKTLCFQVLGSGMGAYPDGEVSSLLFSLFLQIYILPQRPHIQKVSTALRAQHI